MCSQAGNLDPVNSIIARIQSELVTEQVRELLDVRYRSLFRGGETRRSRWAVSGESFLRALCPPMTSEPTGLLGSDLDTRKLLRIMARQ